jgi:hypothetical protein
MLPAQARARAWLLVVLAATLALLFGCDTSPTGREISQQTSSALSAAPMSFGKQAKSLCPLGDADVWARPFASVSAELITPRTKMVGEREYRVQVIYWCRGKTENADTISVEGTAVSIAKGTIGTPAVSLSGFKNEHVGEVPTLLQLLYFLVPPLLVGLTLVFVAAGDVWIWLAGDLWWLALVRWIIMIPALAVPTLLLAGLGGTGVWAYQVYHSGLAVLVSPLVSLPITNFAIRSYLKQLAKT